MMLSGGKSHDAELLTRRVLAEDLVIVLADLQPQIVHSSRTNSEAILRRASGALTEGARLFGIPLVRSIIRLDRTEKPKVIDELAGEQGLIRTTVGVFDHAESRDVVKAHNRPLIAVGGVSTEIAVLHTVLGARRLGYLVHVLVDVCGSQSVRAETAATLSSVATLLTSIAPDLESPEFGTILSLLRQLWPE